MSAHVYQIEAVRGIVQTAIEGLGLNAFDQKKIDRYRSWVAKFPSTHTPTESIFNANATNISIPISHDYELYRIFKSMGSKGLAAKVNAILSSIDPTKGLFYAIGICSYQGDGGGQVSLGLPIDILSMIAGALYTADHLGIGNVTCLIGDDIALGNPLFRDNNGGQRAVNAACLYYRSFIKTFVQQLGITGVSHQIISGADYRDDPKYKLVYTKASSLIKPEDIGFDITSEQTRSVDYYRRQVAAIYHLTVTNNIGIKLSWTSGAKNALDERTFDVAQNRFSELMQKTGDLPYPLSHVYINPGKTWHLRKNKVGIPTVIENAMPYTLLTAQGGFENRFAINGPYDPYELYKSFIVPRLSIDGELCWPENDNNPQRRGQPKNKLLSNMMHHYAAQPRPWQSHI